MILKFTGKTKVDIIMTCLMRLLSPYYSVKPKKKCVFGSRSKSDALTRDVSADLRENTEQEACEQTQFIIQVKSGSRRSAEGLFTHMYRHKPAILTARRPARRLTLGQHDKRTRRRGDELKLSLFTTQMKAAVRRPGQTGGNAELQQEADEPARTHRRI